MTKLKLPKNSSNYLFLVSKNLKWIFSIDEEMTLSLKPNAPPLKQQNHNKSNEKTNPHVEGQRLIINICINNLLQYNITYFTTRKSVLLIILTYATIIFNNNFIRSLTTM